MGIEFTRNFCIIAHIDHGKTTFVGPAAGAHRHDRDAGYAGQLLDSMDLERERGITIKAHPVTMHYKAPIGRDVSDQPDRHSWARGFRYEVSRSLAACEGALLVVDAAQGVRSAEQWRTCISLMKQRLGDCTGHQQNRSAER